MLAVIDPSAASPSEIGVIQPEWRPPFRGAINADCAAWEGCVAVGSTLQLNTGRNGFHAALSIASIFCSWTVNV